MITWRSGMRKKSIAVSAQCHRGSPISQCQSFDWCITSPLTFIVQEDNLSKPYHVLYHALTIRLFGLMSPMFFKVIMSPFAYDINQISLYETSIRSVQAGVWGAHGRLQEILLILRLFGNVIVFGVNDFQDEFLSISCEVAFRFRYFDRYYCSGRQS
ncbi:unnamed protein product [Periconia digitata]|uniref:Uncharacterized protein n=1 Tax=Periconia digitata TaxID=1303443 RepID=A0A9W4ULA8_9PLEO|nr:unnamed protein product [Periconia digitata]